MLDEFLCALDVFINACHCDYLRCIFVLYAVSVDLDVEKLSVKLDAAAGGFDHELSFDGIVNSVQYVLLPSAHLLCECSELCRPFKYSEIFVGSASKFEQTTP